MPRPARRPFPRHGHTGPRPPSRGGAGRARRAAAAHPTCEAAQGSRRCPGALPTLAAAGPGASFLPAAPSTHVRPLLTYCPSPDGEAGRRGGVWGEPLGSRRPFPAFSSGNFPRPPPWYPPSSTFLVSQTLFCYLTRHPCFSAAPSKLPSAPPFPTSPFEMCASSFRLLSTYFHLVLCLLSKFLIPGFPTSRTVL